MATLSSGRTIKASKGESKLWDDIHYEVDPYTYGTDRVHFMEKNIRNLFLRSSGNNSLVLPLKAI